MSWDLGCESANWAGDHFSAYYRITRIVDNEIGVRAGVYNPKSPDRDHLDPVVMNVDAVRYRQIFPLVNSLARSINNFRRIRSNCAGWTLATGRVFVDGESIYPVAEKDGRGERCSS